MLSLGHVLASGAHLALLQCGGTAVPTPQGWWDGIRKHAAQSVACGKCSVKSDGAPLCLLCIQRAVIPGESVSHPLVCRYANGSQ